MAFGSARVKIPCTHLVYEEGRPGTEGPAQGMNCENWSDTNKLTHTWIQRHAPPPPPNSAAEFGEFAELFGRVVGFLDSTELFCQYVGFPGFCPTTDSLLVPGLAVQMCLLHPRQHVSLCIAQNTSFFTISGCSCKAVNCMYAEGRRHSRLNVECLTTDNFQILSLKVARPTPGISAWAVIGASGLGPPWLGGAWPSCAIQRGA